MLNTVSADQVIQCIQFHWQLETTNSRFWLVNILLPKFDTSSKKVMKIIKTQVLSTLPIDELCNMLQTLERGRKYIGAILSDGHTQ